MLITEFGLRFPQYADLLYHIPNGGKRGKAEAGRFKAQGVKAGVSDLHLPVARAGFHGLWIEFKAAPPNDAAVSDSQKDWIDLMRAEGHYALVCKGVDAAMAVFMAYLAGELTANPDGYLAAT